MNKKFLFFPIIMGIFLAIMFIIMFRITDSAQNQREYLIECTTPGTPTDPHDCFDDSQKRLGEAISQISKNISDNIISYLESH